MIQIKPKIDHSTLCPNCNSNLASSGILWQGIHVCAKHHCEKCKVDILSDLSVGHSIDYAYKLDLTNNKLYGSKTSAWNWYGLPLQKSIANPSKEKVSFKIDKIRKSKEVVILNCIDYLYGHSLLKLLNADSLLKNKAVGVIVLIPKFLEWMVPKGVAEVWVVDIKLSHAQDFYKDLNRKIDKELKRFKKAFVSRAVSHPSDYDIKNFTRVAVHDNLSDKNFRISFIWREDRPWTSNEYLIYGLRKLRVLKFLLYFQYVKVLLLMTLLRLKLPEVKLTVVGLGKSFKFPGWVNDARTDRFTRKNERLMCRIYSESRVVVGVHGSNMLLPTAHAGMVVNLVPNLRLGNFAQDVLYQEPSNNIRMISFKYRYFPISTSVLSVANNIRSMIRDYNKTLINYK